MTDMGAVSEKQSARAVTRAQGVEALVRSLSKRILPLAARRRISRLTCWPPVGLVRFGSLRRLRPISESWGTERGLPVDRYYIERFLAAHAEDIRGKVLEIGDDTYTRMFGGMRVTKSEVLHVSERSPKVTILADLATGEGLPSADFDCVILTQTLQFIYDVPAVLRTVYRILKPSGVVLATAPGLSKISRYDMDRWGHYWGFTTRSLQPLFETVFPPASVQINTHGNVLAATAFLHGIAAGELRQREVDYVDPDYEVLITIRAVKPGAESCAQ